MNQATRHCVARLAAVATAVVAVDLATKLVPTSAPRQIPGIESVTNPGLALGIVSPTRMIVVAMALAGLVVFGGWCIQRTVIRRLPLWPTGLLVGGALANLIDRVVYGTVRDFIATPWVIFNFADIALVIGLGGYLYYSNSRQRSVGSASLNSR